MNTTRAGGAPAVNWVAEGDSITFGLGGQPAYAHIALASMSSQSPGTNANLPVTGIVPGVGKVSIQNIATSGISAITIDGAYSTRAGAAFVPGTLNLLTLMIGTNTSGASDASAEQKYFFVRDYIRKAAATGYSRFAVGTMTPRDDDAGVTWTNVLVPLNNYIRQLFNSDLRADVLLDWTTNVNFDAAADADNTSFFVVDKVHPNVAGEALMGSIAQPNILLALQAAQPRIISPLLQFSPWDANSGSAFINSATTITAGQAGCLPEMKSGKWEWQFNVDAVGTGGAVGLFNSDVGFNVAAQALFLGNSFAWGSTTGTAMNGSGAGITPGNYTTADRLHFAYDAGANLFWMRIIRAGTPQNWNGNASANPLTGAQGLNISTIASPGLGYVRPAVADGTSAQYTCKFSAASMTNLLGAPFSTFGP